MRNKRFYFRGWSWLGILNTVIGSLFNVVLVKTMDTETDKIIRWSFMKATDF